MFLGSITALVTPFTDEGECVDFDLFRQLIKIQLEAKSDGVVIGGTTGESPTLEVYELEKMVQIAVEECQGKIPVIVGTGTNATKKSVRSTEKAKALGASGCLVTVPYYNKPTRDGITKHFTEVASVGLPVVVYHHPGRTGVRLSVDHVLEICEIKNVVAFKDSSGDANLVTELLEKGRSLSILCGDDEFLLEYMNAGAVGTISVLGNLMPQYWKSMITSIWNGDFDRAEEMFENVRDLVWATNLEVNPQGIKCAMAIEKKIQNILRLPHIPVTEKTYLEIKAALDAFLEEAMIT